MVRLTLQHRCLVEGDGFVQHHTPFFVASTCGVANFLDRVDTLHLLSELSRF